MAETTEPKKVMTGAPRDADPDDPDIKDTLSKVLVMQNSNHQLVKIISVKKQVVAGTKYIIEFEAKTSESDDVKVYIMSYVLQPWISKEPQFVEFKTKS